ncbi:hypothetical protein QE412_000381 [Microbacterium trichothecenolyticum]|uniref:Bacteriocin biosynthesis cyclodehydratase domain-containing protein n=1 Tax=Microbacterium trichothecenolyticum TaxID=69370 RepID=A0ABU0TQ65_MICTR|nr:hypothetical protein [Microbacterium trichothecenolyticum]
MIRLDPAAPPLWLDDGSVQFGAPAVARVTAPSPWLDAFVLALDAGTTAPALRALTRVRGGTDRDADALLAQVSPALRRVRRRVPLVVQTADDLPAKAVRAVLAALPGPTRAIPWAGVATEPVVPGTRVVVLAAHRVDPRRTALYVRDDVVHLPLVLDGASATVGPVVVPGRTACLACLDAARLREEPLWPMLAAQLLARPRPVVDAALAAEAGRAASALLTCPVAETTRSLRLRVDSFRRVWALHRPSEDCHCRSLEESATASAPSARVHVPS